MDYKIFFREAIDSHYQRNANSIMTEIGSTFELLREDIHFGKTSKNPIDRRMEIAGYFLAFMIVLDKQGESFERIRTLTLEIAQESVQPRNKLHALLKKLPAKLVNFGLTRIFLRQLDKKLSKRSHPDGFVARIITDKKETYGFGYGFDILECGICKLYEKHNYKRFASILCEVDHITSSLAGLKLVRSGTIANGAKKCDFRFIRSK